ncbi:MITOGEN-ACTIVATED PROTEIN KINASE KINASE KINASE KINASE4, TARGET OF TEMPERATURE3 [Hibiscus trionum]|uniref:MITOGEN-ACTIVATED PROTEIN KINASE KINASE KINASE KINASE4, TARGET OF TEMPERATURE3 n=1 Tax=Hibiscus trionum TaxID=183268 RepID=A0A9W7M3T7_HIBTR|nr:MITOGEN-ACTIVATED PROTEIN KINASE KINASE KINASE KINASE4, TARGET OF TEMPERATURE3 [Hibiscus trionum]
MERPLEKRYPVNAKDYKIYEEVGDGVSATVYRALCIPLDEIVAIKVLDLEKCNNDLDGIRREVQTLSLIDHPNVLRAHCSFTAGHNLWVVMPYMAGGSCLHIMKSDYPEGFEEPVISTVLREVLKALVYLHAHGHIHRDVKAGNILIDSDGAVKLADFGVSACMFDTGDRQRSRNTFVGTPCWMAPEVMQQLHGYDFKADIWSFGITALELAHGHAPFSKYPPMKVLLMTLQNAPPGLDYERDKRFSKSFKEMVATCLAKDPKKRPTSEKLLKHRFFKNARSYNYLARTILDGLTPLGERFRLLKTKEADLVQNKALYEDMEQLSQQEYIRGISAWNFNLEDLKSQAALIQDYNDTPNAEDQEGSRKQRDGHDVVGLSADNISQETACSSIPATSQEEVLSDLHDLESSLASFPIKPLQALTDCFDIVEYGEGANSPNQKGVTPLESEQFITNSSRAMHQDAGRYEGENSQQRNPLPHQVIPRHRKFWSGSLIPDSFSPRKVQGNGDSHSGPLFYRQRRETNTTSSEDALEGPVVRRGRFKMTSVDLSPKGSTSCSFNPATGGLTYSTSLNKTASLVLPSLQSILQQNTMQREEIIRLIKYLEQTSGKFGDLTEVGSNDLLQIPQPSAREKELQSQVLQLQQSIGNLFEELQRQKSKNMLLKKLLNASTDNKE